MKPVITFTPQIDGLDEFKATVEKINQLTTELAQALEQLEDSTITVEVIQS